MMAQTLKRVFESFDEASTPGLSTCWALSNDPPAVTIRNQSTGVELLLEDLDGEILASIRGCSVEGTIPPESNRVVELVGQFSRSPVLVVTRLVGSVKIGAWLEIEGKPLVYGDRFTTLDRLIGRLPCVREERHQCQSPDLLE